MTRALLWLAFAGACSPLPTMPGDAVPVAAVAFDSARAALSQCLGRPVTVEEHWYVVPDGALGAGVMGEWEAPHTLLVTTFVWSHHVTTTIEHEMLHNDLQTSSHPPPFSACGLMP